MAHTGGTISAPVRLTQDIQPVLGVSGGLSYCYAHGSVNKWALHKPVMLITGYDTPGDIRSQWLNYMQTKVRETNANVLAPFALKVGTSTNIYEVIGGVSAPAVDWVYQQPSEQGSFWRRMLDCDRYSANANPPMNPVGDFLYYGDSVNVLYIDTNDGEASDTSIQVSQLTQLASYKLMVAVKVSSSLWAIAVMSTVISQSVDANSIQFALPTNYNFSAGTYDAYVVGLVANSGVYENTWVTLSDSAIRNFYTMLPLPFAAKGNCKFNFKVQAVAPTNVVYLSYTLYLQRSTYALKRIEFWAQKYGSTPSGFVLSVINIVVHDDNETQTWPLTGEVFRLDNFSYDSTTRQSTCAVLKDVQAYSVNAGDYPNLTYKTQNNAGYTVQDGGFNVEYVD